MYQYLECEANLLYESYNILYELLEISFYIRIEQKKTIASLFVNQ